MEDSITRTKMVNWSEQRGDVVLAAFPFTDLSGAKRCPADVLSTQSIQSDLIPCFYLFAHPILSITLYAYTFALND